MWVAPTFAKCRIFGFEFSPFEKLENRFGKFLQSPRKKVPIFKDKTLILAYLKFQELFQNLSEKNFGSFNFKQVLT